MKNCNKGFTLTELMVAATLGLILLMMVGYTLNNASRAVNGTINQVSFHNRANALFRKIVRDFESMDIPFQSGTNWYPRNVTIDSNTSFVFLANASSLDIVSNGSKYINPIGKINANDPELFTDKIWVAYNYDSSKKLLCRYWREADYTDAHDYTKGVGAWKKEVFDRAVSSFSVSPSSSTPPDNAVVRIELENEATEETRLFEYTLPLPR